MSEGSTRGTGPYLSLKIELENGGKQSEEKKKYEHWIQMLRYYLWGVKEGKTSWKVYKLREGGKSIRKSSKFLENDSPVLGIMQVQSEGKSNRSKGTDQKLP